MNIAFKSAAVAAAMTVGIAIASPAQAALTLGATPCALTDITPTASACRGWYTGNLVNGSPVGLADQAAALNSLLGVATYTGPTLTFVETLGSLSGGTIDFLAPLFGDTVIAVHAGAATGAPGGIGYNGTSFFRFNAGNLVGGLNTIGFNRPGLSNARLYYTGRFVPPAVPEPSTWMMLLAGLGIIGSSMRRRRRVASLA